MKQPIFPKDFLWGASTAAHQVEGGNRNQWTEWETTNAERLAQTAEQRLGWLPNWEDIKAKATDPENYISGPGVEHYTRYEEDFDLLKALNMKAYRFGIEWARVEPEEGVWDMKEIAHYRRYIKALQARGIEPIPTLWHWTMPLWFIEKGGLEKRRNIMYLERFAKKIAEEFGDDLKYVLILNEPNVYVSQTYISRTSEWPPARRKPLLTLPVYVNLTRAHNLAAQAMKAVRPGLSIGLALHMSDVLPLNPANPASRLIAKVITYLWSWWFIDRTKHTLDFIGVNFYHTMYVGWYGGVSNSDRPVSDLGWYMEPSGIGRLLEAVWRRYHKPIIITENGLADAQDEQRQWWLEQTVDGMEAALTAGVDLRGYLHWSLLDNFEWAFGWWPKFGLIAVDRKTMKRTIRPSAKWLAAYIQRLDANRTGSVTAAPVPKQRQSNRHRGK